MKTKKIIHHINRDFTHEVIEESKKIMKNSTLHKQQKDAEAVHNHFARLNRNFLSLKGDWSLGRRNQSGVLKKHR